MPFLLHAEMDFDLVTFTKFLAFHHWAQTVRILDVSYFLTPQLFNTTKDCLED